MRLKNPTASLSLFAMKALLKCGHIKREPVIVYGLSNSGGGYVVPVVEKPTEVAPRNEPKLVVETSDEPAPESTTEPSPESYPGLEPDDYNLKPNEEVEPRPEEGKTLEGYDGELIEIIDEE